MYSTVLTQIGMAQLMNSQITGTALRWSKMGVGDGGGSPVVVSSNRTALVNERYQSGINHLYRDPNDSTQIIAELVMQPEEGGYTIREVGIYDTDDNLVVYGSLPEVVKPVLTEGSGVTLTIRCRAAIGNATNIRLIIDPTTVIATRKYVDDEIDAHSDATDAHPLASAVRPGFMSASDKLAVDKSFRGIKVGDQILYPSGEHQHAELVPQSPVILTPDAATGKITVSVDASVTAKAGAVPMADTSGLPSPTWGCLPPGWIGFFATNTVPSGFLFCNGAQNLNRVTYARLFASIGTLYGAGDGSTTFGIPDLRGKFLRGYLDGVTEAIGTPQGDAIRNITAGFAIRKSVSSVFANVIASSTGAFALSDGTWTANIISLADSTSNGQSVSFDSSRVVPTALENRPVNMAMLPCIKY